MTTVHLTIGVIVILSSLGAGVWGCRSWFRRSPSAAFWPILRTSQVAVVVQAVLGILLISAGYQASDEMHYVYGILPLAVTLATEAVRAGSAQRIVGDRDLADLDNAEKEALAFRVMRFDTGVMALGALVVFGLAFRAAMVSGAF